jgi:hypothetical protein
MQSPGNHAHDHTTTTEWFIYSDCDLGNWKTLFTQGNRKEETFTLSITLCDDFVSLNETWIWGRQSQWPHGLRHGSWTLRHWECHSRHGCLSVNNSSCNHFNLYRNPILTTIVLNGWNRVFLCCVRLCCVVQALCQTAHPTKESYQMSKRIHNFRCIPELEQD